MEQNEDQSPEIEEKLVAIPTEESLRMQITDVLLNRSRDVWTGRSSRKQNHVLQQIEAALETYGSYFYPTAPR